jgi:hypothetical protein
MRDFEELVNSGGVIIAPLEEILWMKRTVERSNQTYFHQEFGEKKY